MYRGKRGRSHPLFDTIQKLRSAYLALGFEEVVNPIFVDEADIFRQWEQESPVILDRCYYLAGLPRPDVGMSKESVEMIRRLGIAVDRNRKVKLQKIFHEYKKGAITGEDLTEQIARALDTTEEMALEVLDRFPELKALEPDPTHLMLRSHMTSGWFLSLKSLQKRKPLPIKLFSVDRCFRREQKEDVTHLKTHHSASAVIMGPKVDVSLGEDVSRQLLRHFDIVDDDIRFAKKKRSASYYLPNTETEVFARYQGSKWIEVADFGIYSDTVLDKYDITHPVMNLGLGAERLAMLIHGVSDIRELVYPQFYQKWTLSDDEIAKLLRIDRKPQTKIGREIAKAIIRTGERSGDVPSPCEFIAYEGRKVRVVIRENERGKKLLGPAAFNEFVVHKGNIIGLPRKPLGGETALIKEARKAGVRTGIRYIDGFAQFVASEIERRVERAAKGSSVTWRVATVKSPASVNVEIDDLARRYVTSRGLKIDVRGPSFIEISATFG
ncbi:MAG: O-phosphoserine--tRNA ligase [Candidatus Bathyarchaeia archaeon]